MKKTILKIFATLLIVANLFALSSCANTSWVAKAGDDTVPAGVYLNYLIDAYYSAAYSVENQQIDMFKQKIGDVDVEDYIKNTALDGCKRYLTINKLFDEYKLSMTDEEMKEFENESESLWSQISAIYEENGCGKESFFKVLLSEKKYKKIFEFYYGKDGKEPLAEKDRKEYFAKNYAKIKYIEVNYSTHFENVTTSADASDKQKTEIADIAEKYLFRLGDGESIDKLIAEEKALAEADDDSNTATEVTEQEYTFVTKDTSDNPDDFNKAIFEANFNAPSLIQNNTYGYYVYIRYEIDIDKDFEKHASDVLSSMRSEAFEKILNETAKQINLTQNNSAIKRYKPQNVSLGA